MIFKIIIISCILFLIPLFSLLIMRIVKVESKRKYLKWLKEWERND